MEVEYMEVYTLVETLHRQFLDVIQLELDRHNLRDLDAVRAMLLYNMGSEEMTVSELMWRGCYLGSNVSYSVKKLVEGGYMKNVRSEHDKRLILVRNTEAGLKICRMLDELNFRNNVGLREAGIGTDEMSECREVLKKLQKYWGNILRAGSRNLRIPVPG